MSFWKASTPNKLKPLQKERKSQLTQSDTYFHGFHQQLYPKQVASIHGRFPAKGQLTQAN